MKHPSPIDLSRALAEGVDARMRAHLDICDACNEALVMHATIADDVRRLPVVDPDDDRSRALRASLLAAARDAAPASRRGFVLGFTFAGALAAAAVAAFLLMRAPTETAHVARGKIQPHDGAELVHIDKPDEVVRLSGGSVTVQVAQLDARERFRVVVGDDEIESRGATFDVRANRDRLESVRVYDGQVEIRADGAAPRTLVAGERWEIELAHDEPATPTAAGTEAKVAESAVDEPTKPTVPDELANAARPDKPEKIHTRAEPRTQTLPTRTEKIQTRDQPSLAQPTRAKRPIEVLFDEGFATLTAGDPVAAADIFERAARSAPSDPLAEDATFWRASALVRAKSPAAGAALESFLARYSRSPRVGEASAMLGWIVLDRDLDRAEKLFRAAEADRVSSVRASATKGLAAVAARRAK